MDLFSPVAFGVFFLLMCFHGLSFFLWFFGLYAATQLATLLPQRRIQVVRNDKAVRKRLTESNGTPAMDLGHMNAVLK